MRVTTIDRRPASEPNPGSAAPSRRGPGRRQRSERGSFGAALGLSVVIHAALILAASLFFGPRQFTVPIVDRAAGVGGDDGEGIRVYEIVPVADPMATLGPARPLTRPERTDRDRGAALPVPATGGGGGAGVGTGGGPGAGGAGAGRGLSSLERLKSLPANAELLRQPDILTPIPQSDFERARASAYERIQAWNDSVSGAPAPNTDWTFKDKDGKRWGISPEGIHLGGITLPAPAVLPGNQEDRERARTDREIADQADRARVRDRFNDRSKAVRERKEQERKSGGGSN